MTMRPLPQEDPAFSELREAFGSGNLLLFVGAGVSAAAGLPSWERLVTELVDRARARGATEQDLDEIVELVRKHQFVDALSALKDSLGKAEFYTAISHLLDDRSIRDLPDIATAIAALQTKLRAVLTTNVDGLLERAFGGSWPAISRATGDIARQRRVIFKLHGTLLDSSTWVFTRDEYDRALYADPRLRDNFAAMFLTCPILFVGYGLEDDDFEQILARTRALSGDQPPRHFALVPSNAATKYRRKRLESAGVRLIPYPNEDRTHVELTRALRVLGEPHVEVQAPPARPDIQALSVSDVSSLIVKVHSRAVISECIAEALRIAVAHGDSELRKFCELELAGYHIGEGKIDKSSPLSPDHRVVKGYISFTEVNPDYLGWGNNLANALRMMERDPKNYIPFQMLMPDPIASIERQAALGDAKKLLCVSIPAGRIVPDSDIPDVMTHFYAGGDTHRIIVEKVRALLAQKLISALPR
ncbi:SIR2 family protein [Sorangium cellulosum]|uniref:SIR2 family protein n=1 Tax=Sorangium cellulosum TaxID=56 RepID=UPI003D9A4D5B